MTSIIHRKWYYVVLSYACYCLEIENDIIVDAPPIAHWTVGKKLKYVTKWINDKQGTITDMTPVNEWFK